MEGVHDVDILLVGGGVASARCARTLRRGGFEGSILLAGDEPAPPYNRPPLSKELLRDDLPDELVLAEPPAWYEKRDIDLRTGARVAELDAAEGTARLEDGTDVRFARCLLAPGAEPNRLPIPGGERALVLRTLADARRLRQAAQTDGRATVIGAGFIGVEVASVLAALGVRTTLVEMTDRLWGGALGDALATWAEDRLSGAGIDVRLATTVTGLEEGAAVAGDERLAHDFALAAIGVRPRTELAEQAGLAVDDGILTDAAGRTSAPRVWAAGDVARIDGHRVEHWHAAREAGERSALSMLAKEVPPPRPSWIFTEVAGTALDVIGDAKEGDEERWLGDGAVLASTAAGRLVRVAIIGSALDPGRARDLVGRGASPDALTEALAG